MYSNSTRGIFFYYRLGCAFFFPYIIYIYICFRSPALNNTSMIHIIYERRVFRNRPTASYAKRAEIERKRVTVSQTPDSERERMTKYERLTKKTERVCEYTAPTKKGSKYNYCFSDRPYTHVYNRLYMCSYSRYFNISFFFFSAPRVCRFRNLFFFLALLAKPDFRGLGGDLPENARRAPTAVRLRERTVTGS